MFFQTIVLAVLALLLGLAVCFFGFRLFVLLLPLWAFFAGFLATAQAVQELFGGGFLATVSSWVFGLAIGVLFAIAAYFFYYAAIVILAATVGYEIGVGIMAGLGVGLGFLHFLIGVVVAAALTAAVIVLNVPKVFIVVLTALGGAGMILTGVLLALGRIPLPALSWGLVGAYVRSSWFWGLVYLAIAAIGIVAQMALPAEYMLKPYGAELGSFEAPEGAMAAPPQQRPAARPTSAGPEVPAT
jgi:hypothetical protein